MSKQRYEELTGKGVIYDTVIRAIQELLKEKMIAEDTIQETKNRKYKFYSLR